MTQATPIASPVQIVPATDANMYTAAQDNVWKEVLTMAEYIKNPLSGKLRGVTYEDGKIIDVHIRDTDDVVKVFVPVRHGRWVHHIAGGKQISDCWCSVCNVEQETEQNYCPNCGAKMDGGAE